MKKTLLCASLFLLFAVGCEREIVETIAPENSAELQSVSDVIPVEEALKQLDSFRETLNPTTRAVSCRPVIESIAVSGGRALSRSGEAEIPDTMVYVVNFADNKGFAVLGARRSLEDIYAFTESGSLDAGRLDAVMARIALGDDVATSRAADDSAALSPENFIYEMLGSSLLDLGGGPLIGGGGQGAMTLISTRTWWEITDKKGVYGSAKWNQTHPFNWSMPESDMPEYAGSAYMWRHPVGCGVLAVAQMMAAVRHPVKAPADNGLVYEWDDLLTVSNYETLPDYLPMKYKGVNSENTKHLADVLYYLGYCFGANYGIEGGTGVKFENVISALKLIDPYYANAKYDDFDEYAIIAMLDDGKPVIGNGVDSNAGGHAWVFDGYVKRSKVTENVYRMNPSGETHTTVYREMPRTLLHINWGYSGACDGYYLAGLMYNMQDRVFEDDMVDANIDKDHEENFLYNFGPARAIYY